MTKKYHPNREEPKLNLEDLEEEGKKNPKKKWPVDTHEDQIPKTKETSKEASEEIKGILDHPSYKELENKLTEMEIKANEYWNQQIRSQAELENVRRRAELDVNKAYQYSLKKFVTELLPVLDSLERALLSDVNENDYAKKIHEGIELTMSMFLKVMEKFGVKQIHPLNEAFDPTKHQAVSTQASPDAKPNIILEVLQKGYMLNEQVVRPALVVVAK